MRLRLEGEVVTDEILEGILWEIAQDDLGPEDEVVGYAEQVIRLLSVSSSGRHTALHLHASLFLW